MARKKKEKPTDGQPEEQMIEADNAVADEHLPPDATEFDPAKLEAAPEAQAGEPEAQPKSKYQPFLNGTARVSIGSKTVKLIDNHDRDDPVVRHPNKGFVGIQFSESPSPEVREILQAEGPAKLRFNPRQAKVWTAYVDSRNGAEVRKDLENRFQAVVAHMQEEEGQAR